MTKSERERKREGGRARGEGRGRHKRVKWRLHKREMRKGREREGEYIIYVTAYTFNMQHDIETFSLHFHFQYILSYIYSPLTSIDTVYQQSRYALKWH